MPLGTIEHANLSVTQPERSAQLFKDLLGWQERWRGQSRFGGDTIHVSEPDNGGSYMALYTSGDVKGDYSKGQPLNHVGLQVDDLTAAQAAVEAAGLKPFRHDDYDPGRRFYFFDWDGIEFEVVSYTGYKS